MDGLETPPGSYIQSDWPAGVQSAYEVGVARAARGVDDEAEGPLSADYSNVYSQVIGYPGKVQGHGVFFLLEDTPCPVIKAVSSNLTLFFRGTAEALIGKSFTALFSKPGDLESALAGAFGRTSSAMGNMATSNPISLEVALPPVGSIRAVVTIQLQRGPNGIIADVEEIDPTVHETGIFEAARTAAASLESCNNDTELSQHVAWDVFKIFGYDRVLVMKFLEDNTSYVVAERRSKSVKDSFLNMHWPATDTPSSARERHMKKMSSVVVDALDPPAALITGDPALDPNHILLSMSNLKSMHHCYLEQLGIRGMRSSLTVSVLQNGRLWGMVCCFGRGPMVLGAHPRLAVEMLCQAFSTRLTVLGEQAQVLHELKCAELKIVVANRVAEAGPVATACAEALCTPGATILDLLEEDTLGCCVVVDGKVVSDGDTPKGEEVLKIAEAMALRREGSCPTVAVQALTSLGLELALPKTLKTAACLYAPTPSGAGAVLIFRNGEVEPMRWAGKITAGVAGAINKKTGTLHPRVDMAEVVVKNVARPWLKSSTDIGASLATFVGRMLYAPGSKVSGALQDAKLPAWTTTADGIVNRWCPAIEETTGIPEKVAMDKHISQLVLDPKKQALDRVLAQTALDGSIQALVMTLTIQKASQEEMHVHFSGVVKGEIKDGKCVGMLFVACDVGQRREYFSAHRRIIRQIMHVQPKATWLHPNFVHVTDDQLDYYPHKDNPDSALLRANAFGKTFRMVSKEISGRIFAVRRLNIKKAEKAGTPLAVIKRRVLQLLSTDHPSIPNFRCCFLSGDKTLCLVMDDCEGTSLADVLNGTPGGFEKGKCEAVLSTIARALEGLHRRGFGHGNLKSANVMIVDGTASKLKLMDFGVLVCLHPESGNLPVGSSPQRCEGLAMTPEDDLWSMGCILFELISGVPTERRHTVEGAHNTAALTPDEVLAAAEDCSRMSSLATTGRKLLRSDPAERPTTLEIAAWETFVKEPSSRQLSPFPRA